MIERIRRREEFRRLQREGRRIRTTHVWCTYLVDPSIDHPRFAFAIGRAAGPAVVRNRLRRRLREVARHAPSPSGWYLIGVRPGAADLPGPELRREAEELFRRISGPRTEGA